MTGSVILDVIIGLVFIYLLYSLLASILQEFIAVKLAFRSKILEKAILRMLEDGKTTHKYRIIDRFKGFAHLLGRPNLLKNKKIASWFYAHPLIKYLGEDNFFSKPAYISSRNFSKVLIDLLHGLDGNSELHALKIKQAIETGTIATFAVDTVNEKSNPAIEAISAAGIAAKEKINEDTTLFLQSLWRDASGDVNKFRTLLEQWFDDTMDRATGWYKRYTKYLLFIIGLIIAIGFNLDTISIVKKLARDPKLREQLVNNASAYMKENQDLGMRMQAMREKGLDSTVEFLSMQASYDDLSRRSRELSDSANSLIRKDIKNVNDLLGMGWDHGFLRGVTGKSIIGWLITAFALSLGAPFWYDMLSKLMKVKNSTSSRTATDGPAGSNTPAAAPVTVHVNTQSGEEAVG
ncbi:hypothetical protein [Foetidibacter luteolus]|uniref:hypothetical protein n=1 Tax=Foetidibacter luteolus TaxID=2608880 RepID=UPI00129BC714|nr:hypothetical protein [Foetidibacter luteolus]